MTWYQITAPHASAAIGVDERGRVAETAPIFRKLFMGRPIEWVLDYVKNAEWGITKSRRPVEERED